MLIAAVCAACSGNKQSVESHTEKETPVTLSLAWETDTVLTTCESVIYDPARNILYVSNINGMPDGKDGNGFISRVSLEGTVTEGRWATGMDAPKGMGLIGDKLYVTDIDRVHEIDVLSGTITRTHAVEGAQFLNDITTDDQGRVFISDMRNGTLYVIENNTLSAWKEGLAGPNGLLADNGKLLTLLWNSKNVNTIDMATKEITAHTDSIDNPDGIEALGGGAYLVSSWNGMVHHIDADWKKTLILDTRADSLSAADIEYIPSKNLLLVPTFFKNKVMAYTVN